MTPLPARPMYPHLPRALTPAENAAITAQCITATYPDDLTPVPLHHRKKD